MRSDNHSLISAARIPLGSYAKDNSGVHRNVYEMGEYVPGVDEYLELCGFCPFEDCIRHEGEMAAYKPSAIPSRQYHGCLVWEQGKIDYEEKVKNGGPKEGWRGRGKSNGNGRSADSD